MKLSEAFPSNYLKSDDLMDRDVPVVIATAEMEMVGSERKLVLSFQGKKKNMICNKTNAGRIAFLYGDDTDEWTGKEIILTSEFVEFQGKTVKGLRVKAPPKRGQGTAPAQQSKPQFVAEDRGKYDVMRRTAPVQTADDDLPSDEEIPF